MISPQQEAISLKEEPLPLILTEDDEWLPSKIYQIDEEVGRLQDQIKELQTQRTELLTRAVDVGINEDKFCIIREKVRSFRKLDIAAFRAYFPQKYDRACEILRGELEEEINRVGEKIPLNVVDLLVKKKDQGPIITTTESRSYSVERKEGV